MTQSLKYFMMPGSFQPTMAQVDQANDRPHRRCGLFRGRSFSDLPQWRCSGVEGGGIMEWERTDMIARGAGVRACESCRRCLWRGFMRYFAWCALDGAERA